MENGSWLSVVDYAHSKKVSISTIRRSIKANHLKYKEENGKYYIWTTRKMELSSNQEFANIQRENQKLKEEIEDLKMLLSVYESQHLVVPELPCMEISS